jgi:hypothetical protein
MPGTLSFVAAVLATASLIAGVVYAVAYVPFSVAVILVIGYLARRRWTPGLSRRVREFLTVPDITLALIEMSEPPRLAPARVPIASKSESPSGASADLRNAR